MAGMGTGLAPWRAVTQELDAVAFYYRADRPRACALWDVARSE